MSNGTDTASLILRGSIGATMIAHGLKHARSLDGTAGWFGSIGFKQPRLQAITSAVVEIGAGSALLLGAATPLAAAAVVGTMAVAAKSVHLPNGFFITSEGWEYVAALSASAVALGALGAGSPSIDRLLGTDRIGTPAKRAALVAGIGLAGAAVQLATFYRKPAPKDDAPSQ